MNTLNLQAVMIDLDGTLVDTIGDFAEALNCALADLKVPTASRGLIGIVEDKTGGQFIGFEIHLRAEQKHDRLWVDQHFHALVLVGLGEIFLVDAPIRGRAGRGAGTETGGLIHRTMSEPAGTAFGEHLHRCGGDE